MNKIGGALEILTGLATHSKPLVDAELKDLTGIDPGADPAKKEDAKPAAEGDSKKVEAGGGTPSEVDHKIHLSTEIKGHKVELDFNNEKNLEAFLGSGVMDGGTTAKAGDKKAVAGSGGTSAKPEAKHETKEITVKPGDTLSKRTTSRCTS